MFFELLRLFARSYWFPPVFHGDVIILGGSSRVLAPRNLGSKALAATHGANAGAVTRHERLRGRLNNSQQHERGAGTCHERLHGSTISNNGSLYNRA